MRAPTALTGAVLGLSLAFALSGFGAPQSPSEKKSTSPKKSSAKKKPALVKSTTAKSTTAKSTTAKSTTAKSTAAKSTTAKSASTKSAARPVSTKSTAKAGSKTGSSKTATSKTASAKGASSKTHSSKTASSKPSKGSQQAASRYRRSAQQQPTPARYQEIQQALADKGYFSGQPDGQWGASSVDALKRFQHDQNLTEDGKIGSVSLIALGLGPKRGTADKIDKPPASPTGSEAPSEASSDQTAP